MSLNCSQGLRERWLLHKTQPEVDFEESQVLTVKAVVLFALLVFPLVWGLTDLLEDIREAQKSVACWTCS